MRRTIKTAVVTGASKGIGKALVNQLIEKAYFVIGTCRSGKSDLLNPKFEMRTLDLCDLDSITKFSDDLKSEDVKVDLWINNAGVGPDLDNSLPDADTFDQTFDVNVKGTMFLTESILPHISAEGIIVNISSKMGAIDTCVKTDSVAYRMSKTALNMYTKILSNRLKDSIRVVSIHPGWVQTTISPGCIHAPLTPKESADRIVEFIRGDFETGIFWDVEASQFLNW